MLSHTPSKVHTKPCFHTVLGFKTQLFKSVQISNHFHQQYVLLHS